MLSAVVLLASGIVDEGPSGSPVLPQYCPLTLWGGGRGTWWGGGCGGVFGTLLGFEESHSSLVVIRDAPFAGGLVGSDGVGGRVCW